MTPPPLKKGPANEDTSTPERRALKGLYAHTLPSSRGGPFFAAFSYPTKISPESIAVYIACHTDPGDTVLDVFAGSGTTGLGALLCAEPTAEMQRIASELGVRPTWGPRNAVLVEVGALGAFVSKTLCSPPDTQLFMQAAGALLDEVEEDLGGIYDANDPTGVKGTIRHTIWSDVIRCKRCGMERSFWDCAVSLNPAHIGDSYTCSSCGGSEALGEAERVYEASFDPILGRSVERRKRVIARIHGETNGRAWQRPGTEDDLVQAGRADRLQLSSQMPIATMPWGDLYRSGYHKGITHAHQFYTRRNLAVFDALWCRTSVIQDESLRDALRFLLLSYNATHSTLMTRVVVKSGQSDLVLTGAQSGVLYLSSLPVEKNLFTGLRRKAIAVAKAFAAIPRDAGSVRVIHDSSTKLDLADESIDYVFTDPPFGDYIPYAELNFLNEVWLGTPTNPKDEVVISPKQGKSLADYKRMMSAVFTETNRVLKPNHQATVVFHSAKAGVWLALQQAYLEAGFEVTETSILDKSQGSFKQVTSAGSVKGDPLLLLEKSDPAKSHRMSFDTSEDQDSELRLLVANARGELERSPERLFSRYVSARLEKGLAVEADASDFYARVKELCEAE